MQNHLFALLAAFVLVACGGAEADLQGTWKPSSATIDELVKEAPPQMRAMAKTAAEKTRMTFEDGKCTMEMPMRDKKDGTYTVKSSDGNKITIEIDSDNKKEEMVIEIDGDTLTATSKGKTMTFVRVE